MAVKTCRELEPEWMSREDSRRLPLVGFLPPSFQATTIARCGLGFPSGSIEKSLVRFCTPPLGAR
ncbi:hypothetical protein HPP92_013305 [Vanilla planifolia]|uniref:Uncharacterized protein n=1 Tax=Vanilla planifolia TaxID=51239 RepID=A0A835V0H6_VANPL|nr:hypothetical protein HPP92_013305 [Vanilla planifolia]